MLQIFAIKPFGFRPCTYVAAVFTILLWVNDSANASWLSEAVHEARTKHPALEIAYWISQIVLVSIAIVAAFVAYMQVTLYQRIVY